MERFRSNYYPDLVSEEHFSVGGCDVDSRLLRRTEWELKDEPQSMMLSGQMHDEYMKLAEPQRLERMNRIDEYAQVWSVTGALPDPTAFKRLLKVTDKPNRSYCELFLLGHSGSRNWFGYMPIYYFANLEQDWGFNGEAVFPVAVRGLSVHDYGQCTANSCPDLIAAEGPRAVEMIDRAIAQRLPTRGTLVECMASSQDPQVARWLVAKAQSDDQLTSSSARIALLRYPRTEAAEVYTKWLADGAGVRNVRDELLACRAAKSTGTRESLQRVLAAPSSAEDYRIALELTHELDGLPPMPPALVKAEQQIEQTSYAQTAASDRLELKRNVEVILAATDPRDSAAVGVTLALFIYKGDIQPVHDAGVQILQRAPDNAGRRLVNLLAEHELYYYDKQVLNDLVHKLVQTGVKSNGN